MSEVLNTRVLLRLCMLGILTICLGIVLRSNTDAGLTREMIPPITVGQIQSPEVEIAAQPTSPLVISEPKVLSADAQNTEIGFKLTNALRKTIRAYVIKQDLEVGEAQLSTSVSIYNLDLTNSELLPNQSMTNFEAYQVLSGERHRITVSVDYVDFSDGTNWGIDSARSAERIAAQRAGVRELSRRLKHILETGSGAADTMGAIEASAASITPPTFRSDAWKQDFQRGCDSVVAHLKRAQSKGGQYQVEREIRQLAARFKEMN